MAGTAMHAPRIQEVIGLLIAIVAAFVKIPYAVVLMAIAGIIVALNIGAEDNLRVDELHPPG